MGVDPPLLFYVVVNKDIEDVGFLSVYYLATRSIQTYLKSNERGSMDTPGHRVLVSDIRMIGMPPLDQGCHPHVPLEPSTGPR